MDNKPMEWYTMKEYTDWIKEIIYFLEKSDTLLVYICYNKSTYRKG